MEQETGRIQTALNFSLSLFGQVYRHINCTWKIHPFFSVYSEY